MNIRTGITGLLSVWMVVLSWGIATEGRAPHERPEWWKPYENAPAIEVRPEVVAPRGDTPAVIEEAVTRSAPAGVPETLTVQPGGAVPSTSGIPSAIDGAQVIQEASRELNAGRRSFWHGFALFGAFLLLGGGAVFGVLRWLSNQLPEPPKPTRPRRF